MHRIAASAILVTFLATSVSAALGQYKDWGQSPQAYFLTRAERREWSTVSTDKEAEAFVEKFIARRPKGFTDLVRQRAGMADKYLAVGKIDGSKTLRGKVVILFGPPSKMDMTAQRDGGKRDNPIVSGAMSNINPSGGGGSHDESGSAVISGIPGATTNIYTMVYSGDGLPVLKQSEFSIIVHVDAASGKEWLHGRKDAEALFEKAAEASIAK